MDLRPLVLHIGTHKTGTTTLQATLLEHADALRRQGVFYPDVGLYEYGHHHIAWEFNADPRFNADVGTLTALTARLADLAPPAAVVSSEDFEYLYRQPEALCTIRNGFRDAGYLTEIVVTLRDPASYVESLFGELQKNQLPDPLDVVVKQIVDEGGLTFRGWDYRLNYGQLVDGFADVFGSSHITVLRYDPEDAIRPTLAAITTLTGITVDVTPLERRNARWNPTLRDKLHNTAYRSLRTSADEPGQRQKLTAKERRAVRHAFDLQFRRTIEQYAREPGVPS